MAALLERTRACERCMDDYVPASNRQRFCSVACRQGTVACEVCQGAFLARRDLTGRFCSSACYQASRSLAGLPKRCSLCLGSGPFHNDRSTTDGLATWCTGCAKARDVRSRLRWADKIRERDHQYHLDNRDERNAGRYQRFLADKDNQLARMNAWNRDHPEGRADRSARRRALKLGNGAEPYNRRNVVERDGGICQLCQETVDLTLVWPNPLSLSIDHVHPLSLGGPDTFANVQTSHLVCNIIKGNRVLETSFP